MKTLFVTIGGTMTPGDLLMIRYSHPQRGGVSTLKYRVPPPTDSIVTDAKGGKKIVTKSATPADAVQSLLNELAGNAAWPGGEFQGAAREDSTSFIVKCSDAMSDVVYESEIEGAKTETIKLEVM